MANYCDERKQIINKFSENVQKAHVEMTACLDLLIQEKFILFKETGDISLTAEEARYLVRTIRRVKNKFPDYISLTTLLYTEGQPIMDNRFVVRIGNLYLSAVVKENLFSESVKVQSKVDTDYYFVNSIEPSSVCILGTATFGNNGCRINGVPYPYMAAECVDMCICPNPLRGFLELWDNVSE